jgi:DHA1 family multidrug resistance protein-like MFS transporter
MKQRYRQLMPLLFAVFLAMLGVGIISPLLPLYAKKMGAGGFSVGLIFGLFSLSRSVVMPFYGRLSDLIGRKVFIVAGLAAYCLTSVGYVFAHGVVSLSLVRLFHGLASAAILPIVMAFVGDLTPRGAEGRSMGLFSTAFFAGFGAGPIIGGFISDRLGFDAAFYAMGGLVLLGLVLVVLFVREPEKKAEVTKRYPFREILSSPVLRSIFIYRFVGAIGRSSVFAFLPIFAVSRLSLSASSIGLVLSSVILTTSALQTPFGMLGDRMSKSALIIAAGILSALSLVLIPRSGSLGLLVGVICVQGLSGAMAVPSLTALAVGEGRKIGMGSVMGVFSFAMSVGQFLGPLIAGIMMDMGSEEAPFTFAGGAVLAGTLLFVLGMRRCRPESAAASCPDGKLKGISDDSIGTG